jgi:hypothetical protein
MHLEDAVNDCKYQVWYSIVKEHAHPSVEALRRQQNSQKYEYSELRTEYSTMDTKILPGRLRYDGCSTISLEVLY